LELRPN